MNFEESKILVHNRGMNFEESNK